jgi:sugar phosphate isomerase/epimerase
MRLGGPIFDKPSDPQQWVKRLQEFGFNAAFCPVDETASDSVISEFVAAAEAADIVIAEVGAWSNPISPDEEIRREAVAKCKRKLRLAEQVGALSCVNISGSRGKKWDGPHPDNLTSDTFDMIVEVVREIIDDVKPTRTYYTLETMPWMYPDSAESYLKLIKAIDRSRFAVHLDPVNLICSPQLYFNNKQMLRECFQKLGPSIKGCHAKDIHLEEKLTVHLLEVPAGKGALDYRTYLEEMNRLDPNIPLMLEHLPNEEACREAAEFIRAMNKPQEICAIL